MYHAKIWKWNTTEDESPIMKEENQNNHIFFIVFIFKTNYKKCLNV